MILVTTKQDEVRKHGVTEKCVAPFNGVSGGVQSIYTYLKCGYVAVDCIALNYWGKHKRKMAIRGIN